MKRKLLFNFREDFISSCEEGLSFDNLSSVLVSVRAMLRLFIVNIVYMDYSAFALNPFFDMGQVIQSYRLNEQKTAYKVYADSPVNPFYS